jgi:hypothetical protein
MRVAAVVVLTVAVVACGSSSHGSRPSGDGGTDGYVATDASDDADAGDGSGSASGVGNACTRPTDPSCSKDFTPNASQGDCAGGQICILATCEFEIPGTFFDQRVDSFGAWKGGYCTEGCEGKNGHEDSSLCPPDSLCSATDRQETEQCVRACTANDECRGADGYTCQVDGLGAYADQHLPMPRGQTHSCRPNTACAPTGPEPDAGFLNQPVPLAPGILAASEGNVAYDGNNQAVVTYIGYWPHDGYFDSAVIATACKLDASRNCTWSATTLNHTTRSGFTPDTMWVVDPAVAFDAATGDFYWSWLDYDYGGQGAGSIMRVARSTDGGKSWSAPVDAAGGVEDKPWIAASNGIVFGVVDDEGGAIRVARSLDHGQTWEQHQLLIPGDGNYYPQASVDAAGDLFVAWVTSMGASTSEVDSIRVAMWPAGTRCAILPQTEDCFIGKAVAVQSGILATDRVEEVPFFAALDPADGSYWIAYVRGDRYVTSDIDVVRCVVGANTTCDAPVRVSQPGAASTCGVRILPAIGFDESGAAHVVWMDGRYGNGDRARWWYATSTDGKVWSESVMSDQDSVFTVSKEWSAGWGGDYPGIAAAHGRVVATWSDSRDLPPTGIQPTGFVRQRMFLGVR